MMISIKVLSQEFHKYSHMVRVPSTIAKLQDLRIMLPRKEHGQHHASPFESNYCILNGMCNPLLDRLDLFRRLEAIVYKINKQEPNCWKLDEEVKKHSLKYIQ